MVHVLHRPTIHTQRHPKRQTQPTMKNNDTEHQNQNGSESPVGAIWAQNQHQIIGQNNKIPWHQPGEQQHFKNTTLGGVVIMGHNTWLSLNQKPLPCRHNIIITNQPQNQNKHQWQTTTQAIQQAQHTAKTLPPDPRPPNYQHLPRIWIIGGTNTYQQALNQNQINQILITTLTTETPYPNPSNTVYAPKLNPQQWHTTTFPHPQYTIHHLTPCR